MVEYGNGIGEVGGRVAGSNGAGGSGGGDWGAQLVQMGTDTVNTISALPPAQLLLLIAVILVGLMILRRAF